MAQSAIEDGLPGHETVSWLANWTVRRRRTRETRRRRTPGGWRWTRRGDLHADGLHEGGLARRRITRRQIALEVGQTEVNIHGRRVARRVDAMGAHDTRGDTTAVGGRDACCRPCLINLA